MNTTPLYRHSAAHAREHNELETYRASMQANVACKEAIEAAISTHFDGMHLDKTAVSEVAAAFGKERVSYVWPIPFSKRNGMDASLTETKNGRSSLKSREQ